MVKQPQGLGLGQTLSEEAREREGGKESGEVPWKGREVSGNIICPLLPQMPCEVRYGPPALGALPNKSMLILPTKSFICLASLILVTSPHPTASL